MEEKNINKQKIKISKPPILFSKTQKMITSVESKLDAPLITYWNSQNGSVCQNDVIVFSEILGSIKKSDKVYMFIKSGGGYGHAALRVVNLLRGSYKKIIAFIPLEAASAATMLSIGADEIHMGPLAYLTAVDTSLQHDLSPVDRNNSLVSVSQDELTRVINLFRSQADSEGGKNPYVHLYQYVHPLVIGAVDRASSLSIKLCQDILSYHMRDEEKINYISQVLNSSYPSHSYPITLKEAKKIGLNVKQMDSSINKILMELNEYYSEMGQKSLSDYDEFNYHDNEILNIIEGKNAQIYYQEDKDWHYRQEERRWVPMNDASSWIKNTMESGKEIRNVFHIR